MSNSYDFTNVVNCTNRLIHDLHAYGNICVAFDFDNTLFDYHGAKSPHIPACLDLMSRAQDAGLDLVVWTVRDVAEDSEMIRGYLRDHGITEFNINCTKDIYNFKPTSRKPFFSLLLDDRAGLGHSMRTLSLLLNEIGY